MNPATITAISTAVVAIITAVVTLIKQIQNHNSNTARLDVLEGANNGIANVGTSPNVGGDNGGRVFPNAGTD